MTLTSSVLLPLYFDPSLHLGSWNPIYDAINTHPDLNFSCIINVDSGPGVNPINPSNPYPNSDYIAALAKLNSYPNTQLYGYVLTGYGTESVEASSSLKTNITKYHDWTAHIPEDIHMDGIFFDEVVATYSIEDYTYLSDLVSYTHITFGPGAKTIFNPGFIPDSRYHELADMIVGFEDIYSAYPDKILRSVDSKYLSRTAFLILSFTETAEVQSKIVKEAQAKALGGLFITTKTFESNPFNETSELWSQFCDSMAQMAR